MLVLALGWFVLVGLLTWFRPGWGLVLVIAGSSLYLVRATIFGIPTTALELGIYAAVLSCLINWWQQKRIRQIALAGVEIFRPYRWPLALWLGFTLVSAILSPEWRLSFGILKGWFFDPLLVVWLLVALKNREDDLNPTTAVTYGLTGAALVIAIYGIYDYFWGYTFEAGRLDAWFTSPNYAAMLLAPVLFITAALLWQQWPGRYRNLSLASAILIFAAFILTGSFGGYAAVLAGFIAWLLLGRYEKRFKIISLAVIFGLGAVALVSGLISVKGHYNSFYKVSSWQVRTELQQAAVNMVKQHPILGVGLGRFQRELPILRQNQPELFKLKPELLQFHLPHSLYLTIAAESGLLALLGFLWFVGLWLWHAWQSYRQTGWQLLLCTTAAMVAILVHGLVDTPYFKNDLALLFWAIVLLALLGGDNKKNPLTSAGRG